MYMWYGMVYVYMVEAWYRPQTLCAETLGKEAATTPGLAPCNTGSSCSFGIGRTWWANHTKWSHCMGHSSSSCHGILCLSNVWRYAVACREHSRDRLESKKTLHAFQRHQQWLQGPSDMKYVLFIWMRIFVLVLFGLLLFWSCWLYFNCFCVFPVFASFCLSYV